VDPTDHFSKYGFKLNFVAVDFEVIYL